MPRLIIEECARSGAHLAYHPVDRFPLRIGRSLDNDLVLADPYVSPHHLIIDDGGDAWMLVDQESRNGTFVGRGERLSGPMCAGSGDRITIGKTVLRLWSPDHPALPTLLLPSPRSLARRAIAPAMAVASLIVTIGVILLQQHLDTEKPDLPGFAYCRLDSLPYRPASGPDCGRLRGLSSDEPPEFSSPARGR